MLRRYLIKIVVVNVIVGIVIALLSHFASPLHVTTVGDFCFEMVVLMWGIAILSWRGGAFIRRASKLKELRKQRQLLLVDTEQEEALQKDHKGKTDYSTELVLFVAGIPCALISAISAYLI